LLLPHIQLNGRIVGLIASLILVSVLIFGVAQCKYSFIRCAVNQALFQSPLASSDPPVIQTAVSVNTDWDIYKLEHEAFAAVAAPEQREWGSRKSIRWLVGAIYLAAIAIPLGFAYPLPTLIVLGASTTLFAVVKAYRWQRRVRALQASWDQPQPREDTPPAGGGRHAARPQHSR